MWYFGRTNEKRIIAVRPKPDFPKFDVGRVPEM